MRTPRLQSSFYHGFFLIMKRITRILCGITLLTMPSIEFGGYFLLQVLSGEVAELALTNFQQAMFRAGHAHAGVLVILSLIALILSDHARLNTFWVWVVRMGFPTAALMVSGGFFASAIGEGLTAPNEWVGLLYAGIFLLAFCMVVLGVALMRPAAEEAQNS